MVSYQSGFSDLIEKYVFYQESSGSWSEVRARSLRYFDRFCAECFPGRALCQEMVDAWCGKRDTESKSSCITRTGVIRSFIKYLRKRGMTDVLPVPVPKAEKRTRVPHAFTKEELQKFFRECDSIIPYKPSPKFLLPKMTCPVFFRLLYSSGIRTTEARKLKRSEVDLAHGILDIRETKGYAQHYVALHASMTDLLRQYDQEVEKIYPGRTYFFENAMGNGYSRQWVVYIFRKLWEKANGKDNRPVAYGLRHHYAVENINRWEEDAFEFSEKLLSLSKSMGHSEINATLYYYSIVPGMSDILREKTETGFNEIIPEVPDEKE